MTARLHRALVLGSWICCAACASDVGTAPSVRLALPATGTTFTPADDVEPSALGIQVNLAGHATASCAGEEFTLLLDPWTGCGGTVLGSAVADEHGELVFDRVTIPPGTHSLQICSADGRIESVPATITVQG